MYIIILYYYISILNACIHTWQPETKLNKTNNTGANASIVAAKLPLNNITVIIYGVIIANCNCNNKSGRVRRDIVMNRCSDAGGKNRTLESSFAYVFYVFVPLMRFFFRKESDMCIYT